MSVHFIQSPIGIIALQDEDSALVRVEFLFGRNPTPKVETPREMLAKRYLPLESFSRFELSQIANVRYKDDLKATQVLKQTQEQLLEYFDGRRRVFNIPLNPHGTEFRRLVWRALGEIPYGKVETYGKLAQKIGKPLASRAVGTAMRDNPIGIILPCHRVVGSSGKLTGYNGGLDRKSFLLAFEAAQIRDV